MVSHARPTQTQRGERTRETAEGRTVVCHFNSNTTMGATTFAVLCTFTQVLSDLVKIKIGMVRLD